MPEKPIRSEERLMRARNALPITIPALRADFTALGIQPGMTVLVHSSLKSLGWVCGGPVAVILALEELLGPGGTLVMPTHSAGVSDPENWMNPPCPEAWWETIRATMPVYQPDLTPTYMMGAIPETFRKQNGVLRSAHPNESFAAWGQHAVFITSNHQLDFSMGEHSPLARIYDLEGYVLLLGVGHGNNTSLHLAEHRAHFPSKQVETRQAPVLVNGQRQWVEFQDIWFDDSDFEFIGKDLEQQTNVVTIGRVGNAEARLMPQRALVDFAITWMQTHRA